MAETEQALPAGAPADDDAADAGVLAAQSVPPSDDAPADEQETSPDAPDDHADRDWKAEYLREVAQSRKYRQRAQRAEAQIERLGSEVLDDRQSSDPSKDQRIGALETMIRQIAGTGELAKALVACGVGSGCAHGPKMVQQAAALLAERIEVDVSGDSPAVRVLDERGQALADAEGRPVAIQQFVAAWLAEEGSHFLPASGDTGSGAHRGQAVAAGVSVEQLDRDPKAKAAYIARHGPQAYVQLARKR